MIFNRNWHSLADVRVDFGAQEGVIFSMVLNMFDFEKLNFFVCSHLGTSMFKSNESLRDPKITLFKSFLKTSGRICRCPVLIILVRFKKVLGP